MASGLRSSGFHVFEYVRANISIPLQSEHFVMESVVVAALVLLHIHQASNQAQVMCHITNVVSVPSEVHHHHPSRITAPRCSSITKVLTTTLAEIDTTIKQ